MFSYSFFLSLFQQLDQVIRQRNLSSLELFLSCAQKQLSSLLNEDPTATQEKRDWHSLYHWYSMICELANLNLKNGKCLHLEVYHWFKISLKLYLREVSVYSVSSFNRKNSFYLWFNFIVFSSCLWLKL